MNELIAKLYDQALVLESNGDYVAGELDPVKFAELIVQECVNVLREESERLYKLSAEEKDELFASNFEICAEKCVDNVEALKEHFGVER
jgi:ABC-type Na+ transport system ATPase subunit NatA